MNVLAKITHFLKVHTGLIVIITAALLLELTTGVLYYSAQNIIQRTMEQLVKQEMNGIAMSIRKQLAKVEVAVNNMDWMIQCDLAKPDSMFTLTHSLVEHNPTILGSGISFKPNYYSQKGRWFEPYSIRKSDSTIETMHLGSESHDYTQREFYTFTMEKDSDHWSEPYLDLEGAHAIVTSYSSAVHDAKGEVVAVVGADISLQWLKDLMENHKGYKSTQRFLVSGEYNLLAGEDSPFLQAILKTVKEDSDHQGYVTMSDAHGEKQHVFYYPIGGITQWKLVCVCSDREIFAPLRHVRQSLLLLVLAGLFLIGFIIWRASRNLERLRKVNAEKERIQGELQVASQIQQSMLPTKRYETEDGVDICGSLVPAREVGGDLFDYFIRDEKLFFCIGDVSGKGAPSAMLMAVTHALFRSASAHESNPARIMQTINETACQDNSSNMFVTLFIGVLDLPTGHLRYCDAGHNAPIIIENGEVRSEKCNPHLPVGVFKDVKYTMQETHLQPDNTLFLYTDGLTEAKNEARNQFGLERTKETLRKCAIIGKAVPRQILEGVRTEINNFVGNAAQSDDLTMLAILYSPKKTEDTLTDTLSLKNDVHEVTRLSSFMKTATEKMDIEKSLARHLRLAVEEAVVNIIDYAYPPGTEGSIDIRIMSNIHHFKVVIIDSGVPFDPTAKEKADITLSAEDRQIGGLGILLMRELMDSINYERDDGKNILTLIKKK